MRADALAFAVALAAAAAVAGCVAPAADDGAGGPAGPEDGARAGVALPYVWTDCVSVQAFVSFDIERARAFLPDGYEPTDGGHLAGMNPGLATGTANMGIMGFDCAHLDAADGPATWAFAYIDIEPPRVADRASPSPHDFYDVVHYVPDARHRAVLEGARLPVVGADIRLALAGTAAGETGRLVVVVDGATLVDVAVLATGPLALEPTAAAWHQSEDGVTLVDLDGRPDAQYRLGTTTSCRLAPGSLLAEVVGASDCTARSPTGNLAVRFFVDATVEHVPGARAEPGGERAARAGGVPT